MHAYAREHMRDDAIAIVSVYTTAIVYVYDVPWLSTSYSTAKACARGVAALCEIKSCHGKS